MAIGSDSIETENGLHLHVDLPGKVNFASAQNAVPLIRSLELSNGTDELITNATLTLTAHPAFCRRKSWAIDRLGPGETLSLSDKELSLDHAFLSGLNEAERSQLTFVLEQDGQITAEHVAEVDCLARDEWGGLGDMASILAAFVSPNDAAVARILKEAAGLLEETGRSPSMEGYQSGDPKRTYMLTAALWSAVTGMGLVYATPPRSFEISGQKIRNPGQIASEGLATCLDTALLFAGAIEAAGLNSVVVFQQGHAFAGAWLHDKTFRSIVEPDVTELRKAVASRELVLFETTFVTQRPAVGFEQAVADAHAKIGEDQEHIFEQAIDICRARAGGIRPLASHRMAEAQAAVETETAPAALPPEPDFGLLPGEVAEEKPATGKGRIERWQRKLLDLSLRNRLLNFSDSKQTVPFLCPDVPGLEDMLADGKRLKIISLSDEDPVGNRDPALYRQETGKDLEVEFAREMLAKGQVSVKLPGKDMTGRLTTLYRKARSDLAEGGTNTLFLAAGFLKWKKSATDKRVYRAPLLLMPVKLTRKSAQSDFWLEHHEDEVRFNATLLQFLERDFGLKVPALLQGELPTDHSGLDLPLIFATMRKAVREVPGFEIVEDLALSTFSFAKYLMWKDLVDRSDSLKENRLVHHLIDSPDTPFQGMDGQMPEAADIDRHHDPEGLFTPLPADSSQLAAVVSAAQGHDFVVIGPPGTGKSQTIANMISHCLANGKTVLFVAEKSAALDVVHRRLKAHGLGDACLELHSNKADRRNVLGQLGVAWDRSRENVEREWVKITDDLKLRRDELNAYVEALHQPGSHGYSVFEAIGTVIDGPPPFTFSFPALDCHDRESFERLAELAERAGRIHPLIAQCEGLDAITCMEFSLEWSGKIIAAAEAWIEEADRLNQSLVPILSLLGLEGSQVTPSLIEAMETLARKMTVLGPEDYRPALKLNLARCEDALVALLSDIAALEEARAKLAGSYDEQKLEAIPLGDLDRGWREANANFWPMSALGRGKVRRLLRSYATGDGADPQTDIQALSDIASIRQRIADSELSALPVYKADKTDATVVREYLASAGMLKKLVITLQEHGAEREALAKALAFLCAPSAERPERLVTQLSDYLSAKAAFEDKADGFARLAGSRPEWHSLADLRAELALIPEQQARLSDWTRWAAVRAEAEARGLMPMIEALEAGRVGEAVVDFRRAYFAWWLPLAIDNTPQLRGFSHWEHQDRIDHFRQLDERARALSTFKVRTAVAHDLPARDGVAAKSELGVLRHQLGLQRPSAPIRSLIEQMPETFPKLAPCVLMSPLSIAQYLPAGQKQFDIVIFDEASQITTWDAVGAIARGRQSIIVGDPKQLPPTNFFGRTDDDDTDDGLAYYEKDLPSILDEVSAAGLPVVQLNWHYRSRDESLIAFSNHHYYDSKLITFPSPEDGMAVCLHKIDGVYARGSGRVNDAEARTITEFVTAKLTDWLGLEEAKRPTLGVITFNAQQQELILDLLDAERRKNPELEWFFADDREEPVIVKNLENIQGDERDIMLFSITFGRDMAGKLSMNFGAVNKDGGEKRLNVAVTRARSELHIFASIHADDIDIGRTKAMGVAHLKTFLDYAERGPVALAAAVSDSLGPADSPFEEAVAALLRAKGWEVRTQIGVSGFRIDLGIVHPDKAGKYLAGVECDGATYHRAATARDRDATREQVLRHLGWEILRIWSTDWFMNAAEAGARLDKELQELLAADRLAEQDSKAAQQESEKGQESIMSADASLVDNEADAEPAIAEPEDRGMAGPTEVVEEAASAPAPQYARAQHGEGENASANLSVLDPERFFEKSYTPVLIDLICDVVASEGPIRDDVLARQIARLHGWQRAGRRIRERVAGCLGDNEVREEMAGHFVWAADSHSETIPFRHNTGRSPREISRHEILGLVAANPQLARSNDPVLELARLMGIVRLSEDARNYLSRCLRNDD